MDIHDLIENVVLAQIKQPLWESWHIREKIGSGSFSVVYRMEAHRADATDEAALKIEAMVDDGLLSMDEGFKRAVLAQKFQMAVNETRIMKQLRDCPNIVRYEEEYTQELYLNGKFEGYYHLIRMEYLKNIYAMMRERTFDYSEQNVRRLAQEIGNGLRAAHSIGTIHRDIKPENMFRSAAGVYKLGDFNVSKQAASTRSFVGSNFYMAPEVLRSKTNAFDSYTTQADIYSFGICLYQMMNDCLLPFEDVCPTETAVNRRLQGEPYPPPKNASPAFAQIIMRACAHKTEDRYLLIEDMLQDLSRLAAGSQRTPAPALSPKPNSTVPAGKRRSIWGNLCVFAGGLVVVLLAVLMIRVFSAKDESGVDSVLPSAADSAEQSDGDTGDNESADDTDHTDDTEASASVDETDEYDPFFGMEQAELEQIAAELFDSQWLTVESGYTYYDDFAVDKGSSVAFSDDTMTIYYKITNAKTADDLLTLLHQTFSAEYDDYDRLETSGEGGKKAYSVTECLKEERGLFRQLDNSMYVTFEDVPPHFFKNLHAVYQSSQDNEVWFTITVELSGNAYETEFSMLLEDGVWKIGACKYPD